MNSYSPFLPGIAILSYGVMLFLNLAIQLFQQKHIQRVLLFNTIKASEIRNIICIQNSYNQNQRLTWASSKAELILQNG